VVSLNSAEKSLILLKRLGDPPYELGLRELAETAGMGKSGTYKLLESLRKQGFIIQDSATKTYHLGPVVLRLGNVYSQYKGIGDIARPVIEAITERTNQSMTVSIWEGERAFAAYKCAKPGKIYDTVDFIGKSIPINAGASAMVLAAFQDPFKIRQILEKTPLQKRTTYTITDKERLLNEYEKIRKQGYAIENEVFSLGVFSVGVPVFDKNGTVWSSMALTAPKTEAKSQRVHMWIQVLKDGAEEISDKLKFRH
jgi:DNA-binding IclR family transcriptional regulator